VLECLQELKLARDKHYWRTPECKNGFPCFQNGRHLTGRFSIVFPRTLLHVVPFGCFTLCYYNRGFHLQTPSWHSWRHNRVHMSDTVDPAVNMTFGKDCGVWQPWPKFCSDEIGTPHPIILSGGWDIDKAFWLSLWANTGKKNCRQELETSGEQQVIDWNSFVLHKKNSKGLFYSSPVCRG
jgi:hypothetical protein